MKLANRFNTFVLLCCSTAALQAAQPDAGTLLQEVAPAPELPRAVSPVLTERQSSLQSDNALVFEIEAIALTGNTLFSDAELLADSGFSPRTPITLNDLLRISDHIADFYRDQGFPVVRAVIPPQEINEGVVLIQVVEARLGESVLLNQSEVADDLVLDTLSHIPRGEVITQADLDRALLLLADLPGTEVKALLKPGKQIATTDLDVVLKKIADTGGSVRFSNYGSEFLRRERLSGSFSLYNPFNRGDELTLNATSSGSRLNYLKLGYSLIVNGYGSQAGIGLSGLEYKLGSSLSDLDAQGRAGTADIWVRQPLLRSLNNSLYGSVTYQHNLFDDRVNSSDIRRDRSVNNLAFALNGEHQNSLFGGYAYWRLALTAGSIDFNNASARQDDAATARTQGDFSKLELQSGYLYEFSSDSRLWVTLAGQSAGGNLDSSQKMVLGGAYSVRAYDTGAIAGDSGYLARLEYQHVISRSESGVFQGVLFADSAHVEVNETPWVAGTNDATLKGVGAGLNWLGPEQWRAQLMIGAVVGGQPALVEDVETSRAWFEISKVF
ncbi:MAG: hypothetical protein OIF55_20140 [Amphritea sp.]|nr:hypothetical protein [Amphritea sp.]